MMSISPVLVIVLAVVIDWLVGEPKRWHPLVGFGRVANTIERHFNAKSPGYVTKTSAFGCSVLVISNKLSGVLALLLLCLPLAFVWHYCLFTCLRRSFFT